MRADLFHSKIIKDTASPAFISAAESGLLPLVKEVYPDAEGILMYEDHIADGYARDGVFYYPLTVFVGGSAQLLWIVWNIDRGFATASPFNYSGDGELTFDIAGHIPEDIEEKQNGRAISYDTSAIKLNVRAASDDPLILVGRYSQSFVDELARQITDALSRAMSVSGIGGSSIELELVFAPGTYMEHTSENVTYRRLLLVDGTSAPRDFWVKWTRVGGGVALTVSDTVSAGDVVFELGEDVAQKIREKEYRFLCSSNPSKYQSAMGKKTVTEWRDLIKRAIRRGELTKLVQAEDAPVDNEIDLKLTEVLAGIGHTVEPSTAEMPEGDFEDIMALVRGALESSNPERDEDDGELGISFTEQTDEPTALGLDVALSDDESSATELAEDGLSLPWDDEPETEPETEDAEAAEVEEYTIDELLDRLRSASVTEPDTAELDDDSDGDTAESDNDFFTEPASYNDAQNEADEDIPDKDDEDDGFLAEDTVDDEDKPLKTSDTPLDDDIADEVGQAPAPDTKPLGEVYYGERSFGEELSEADGAYTKAGLLYRIAMAEKKLAEESIVSLRERISSLEDDNIELRESIEMLREENKLLRQAAESAEEKYARSVIAHREECERIREREAELLTELDKREKEEARERDRLAEAARVAVLEQRRREADEARLREEQLEAERREAEARIREEAQSREREENARRQQEAERRVAAEREAEQGFISRRAKIIFRRDVDLNIIGKIKEIILETMKENHKSHIRMQMRAYQEDKEIINLDILRMPKEEQDLLISIVKAIGNARIGVVKIILE